MGIMLEKCNSVDCSYARYCLKSETCTAVTKDTKKGIANSVAHIEPVEKVILCYNDAIEMH